MIFGLTQTFPNNQVKDKVGGQALELGATPLTLSLSPALTARSPGPCQGGSGAGPWGWALKVRPQGSLVMQGTGKNMARNYASHKGTGKKKKSRKTWTHAAVSNRLGEQTEGRQASGRNEKKETRAHQGKVLS